MMNGHDPGFGHAPYRLLGETKSIEPRVLHVHLKTHIEPQESLVRALTYIAGEYRQIDWMQQPNRLDSDLVTACADFDPTLVFMQLQTANVLSPGALKHAKTYCPNAIFVTWCGDVGRDNGPSYAWPSVRYIHELAGAGLDLALYSSWTQVVAHRTNGLLHAGYLQIGYDEHVYFPDEAARYGGLYDVVFLGQNYSEGAWPTVREHDIELRRAVCVALREQFGSRFGLFGTGWSGGVDDAWKAGPAEYVTSLKTRQIYIDAKVAVSLSLVSHYDKYSSDRLLRALACGTPTFVKRFYDYASWGLVDGFNCILWDTTQELLRKLGAFLALDASAQHLLGSEGAKLAKRHHTWGVRMRELLPLVYERRNLTNFFVEVPW